MGFWNNFRDTISGMAIGGRMGATELANTADFVQEALDDRDRAGAFGRDPGKSNISKLDFWSAQEAASLAELELALEDQSWRDMSSPAGNWNFTRYAINRMIGHARVMFLINPLIRRAVI